MEQGVSHCPGPCLLPLLQPVRHCLHGFLSAATAARLMQASRALTVSLLAGYSFVDHVFTYDNQTIADVKRSIALYSRYHMRIVRMSLPRRWEGEPLLDGESGRSWLPASLEALALGPETSDGQRGSLVHAAFESRWLQGHVSGEENERQDAREFIRRIRAALSTSERNWDALQYGDCKGRFDQPIPPAALPLGLRYLQFTDYFNRPLQVGSIPDTVEVLQFGEWFNQPLQAGHLPVSLTHLVFGYRFNQPLLPGVLPAGLQQLHLGGYYNQPLQPGTLPSQLQQLSVSFEYNQPIRPDVIPPSVTHLRLGARFNQPLQKGSIAQGVEYLDLGWSFNQPLSPGVLPATLRDLIISKHFNRPLLVGSLPFGLEALVFHRLSSFQQPLLPGAIPNTVLALSLGKYYREPLVAGGIPATVRWLRLPGSYEGNELQAVLSPCTRLTTRLLWWPDD